jgi:hypothetical protein
LHHRHFPAHIFKAMTKARPLHPCPEGFLGCDPIQGQCLGFCGQPDAVPPEVPQIEFAGPEPIRWRIAGLIVLVVAITGLVFWRFS